MPFFIRSMRNNNPIKKNNPSTTLQVRIPKRQENKHISYVKRVLLSASLQGSLTIEAAFCLSFMVFAMVLLVLPMKIMNTRRQLQAGLETINEELSRYAYIQYQLGQDDSSQLNGADEFDQALAVQFLGGMVEGYAESAVKEWVDTEQISNLSMRRSSILLDGETLDLILDYQIELPFPILAVTSISQSVRSRRRAWVGKTGQNPEEASAAEEDRLVYIGKNATRYHQQRACHYLSNQLTVVSFEQAADMRNESGGIYHPCHVCGAGAKAGTIVYVMPNGGRYHTQPQCRAIIAYVQTVKLSEVAYLGGCSYCTN